MFAAALLNFGAVAQDVTKYHLVSADPEDGSEVEKIYRIMTQWEGEATEWGVGTSKSKESVQVKDESGDIVSYGSLRSTMSGVQINVDTEITSPGTYSVTILADMVYAISGVDNKGSYIMTEGTGNEETTLTYTVVETGKPFVFVSADPADGSTVERIDTLLTVWESETESLEIAVSDASDAVEARDSSGRIFATGTLSKEDDGIKLSFDDALNKMGYVTVIIKEGMVYGVNNNNIAVNGTGNEKTTLRYFINPASSIGVVHEDGTGIVYADGMIAVVGVSEPDVSVYTLAGHVVMSGHGNILQADGLVKGMYIVKATNGVDTISEKLVVN